MTISAAHALALQHHQAGRLPEAEALYRQILATDENHADAWHLLGVLAQMVGQNAAAVEMIGRAIALLPAGVDYHKNLGIALQGCGRTEEAIAAYRLAAERAPGDAVIWNNLGIALTEQGRLAEAIAACYAAIARQPGLVEAHSNLGNALKAAGQLDAALAAYRQALALAPDYAPAQHNLGTALQEAGQLDAAIDAFHLALRAKPDQPETYNGLGEALRARGRLPEALAAFGEAVRLKPELLRAQLNLSDALRTQGRYEACIAACQEALRWLPAASGLWINLGNALHDLRREPEAIAAYHEALGVEPTSALAYNNLGNAHKDSGQVAAAVEALEKAIELAPHYAEAHNNLACARKDQGRMEAAIEAFREGHRRSPGLAQIQSNLIYTMHFTAGCDAAAIREEHRRWNECYVAPVRALFTPHRNDRDPARRLKVGYVSPDFWEQAECYFVVPLLEAHDHARYEIHAYSSVSCADAVTERLRKCVDVWHDVMPLTDAELAGRIRADGIDVLIDLTMHMAHSRLPLFALRPAPVQMSWLAYPGSTGVETMDCWITDAHMEPPGREADSPGGGEPVRLPDSWCCYDPVTATPEVNALPALAAGHVTFGSLNNFCKNNDAVLGLWARVLGAVPGSRLLLLCPHGEPRGRIVAFFAAHGVAAERVEFFAHHARYEYLRLYQRIDVGLDPFPYNGITTTCDALTMGVPVLTLPGTMPASRAGLSLLTTVGLPELALGSGEEYVAAAAALAADLPRLAELRATLRARMQASPLTDAPRFAGQMEAACRTRWERWCATPEAEAVPVDPRQEVYADLHAGQMQQQEDQNRHAALRILGILREFTEPHSLLDVGCGLGTWMSAAQSLGIAYVQGIEGPWLDAAAVVVEPALVQALDLESPFSLGRRFDLVICLEVAEHLSAAAAPAFVESLVRHSELVLFSAAIPGQGGHHHVNEQFPDYWAELFARRGYVPLDLFRARIWQDRSILWWLRQNVLLFATEGALAGNEKLRAAQSHGGPLAIVHPDVYLSRIAARRGA